MSPSNGRLAGRVLVCLLVLADPVVAQVPVPLAQARLGNVLEAIRADSAWTLAQQISICEIPAPPFKEAARAQEFRRRLESFGFRDVRIDSVGNVIAERPGRRDLPGVMLAGHLDTVFPEGTDVTVKREGARFRGPGISDDCRGLAVVLTVARAFQRAGVATNRTLYFVGDVGEEGAGNLRGVRHLFEHELRGKVGYFVSVDDADLHLVSRAVGSNRYTVSYKGPGGHSYGEFGRVNPIHALGRAVAAIADIQVPESPRTTFNVGTVTGGTSVNAIPFEASAQVDLRSESAAALRALDTRVRSILDSALAAENARWGAGRGDKARLTLQIDTIGMRAANDAQTERSPIVAAAMAAGRALGFTPSPNASSTDANLPMSMGIPAITIGAGGHSGDSHALTEWYEESSTSTQGPRWAALLVAALGEVR
ncbi:MAG TPA: M20/M25/M40 family metallo-hydrolase [Gemmatimonadaceae bacterium]|nr:M20/M25/M40 family metallo-hydrolase [Gemmatimonadaceae bacterium]